MKDPLLKKFRLYEMAKWSGGIIIRQVLSRVFSASLPNYELVKDVALISYNVLLTYTILRDINESRDKEKDRPKSSHLFNRGTHGSNRL
jgi:hypothetical protein